MSVWDLLSLWPYLLLVYFVLMLINLEWRFGFFRYEILPYLSRENKKWEKIAQAYEKNLSIQGFRKKADEIAQAHPELSEMEIIAKAKEEANKK